MKNQTSTDMCYWFYFLEDLKNRIFLFLKSQQKIKTQGPNNSLEFLRDRFFVGRTEPPVISC